MSLHASKKPAVLVKIRESDCIGCTKCIDACPVDAIIGSHKLMHSVITAECIGCKLCLPPCPVDCIELIEPPESYQRITPQHIKHRYQARRTRLKDAESKDMVPLSETILKRKAYVKNAIQRAREKWGAE